MARPRRAGVRPARREEVAAAGRARARDDYHYGQPFRGGASAPAGAVLGPCPHPDGKARRRADARRPLREHSGRQAGDIAARRACADADGARRMADRDAQVPARRRGDGRTHRHHARALPAARPGVAGEAARLDRAGDVGGSGGEPQGHLHIAPVLSRLARRPLLLLLRLPQVRADGGDGLPEVPCVPPRADGRVRGPLDVVHAAAQGARAPRDRAVRPAARRCARAHRAGDGAADGADRAAPHHAARRSREDRGDRRDLQVAPHARRVRGRHVKGVHRDALRARSTP